MKFQPKTAEEIAVANLIPDGEYDFSVIDAENTQSKNGNDMIRLKLCVYSGDKEIHILDYLLPTFERKLRRACEAVGILEQYNKGLLDAEDFKGRNGKAKICIKKQDDYDPKNEVKDYIVDRSFKAPQEERATIDKQGDDIPF